MIQEINNEIYNLNVNTVWSVTICHAFIFIKFLKFSSTLIVIELTLLFNVGNLNFFLLNYMFMFGVTR